MIIDCEHNPSQLIEQIGDPNFQICDETWDELYRHKNHPHSLRIIDCEDDVYIDITGISIQDTRKSAEALCKLLNQDYDISYKDIEP